MDSVWDDARIEDGTVEEPAGSSHAQEKLALIKSTLLKLDQDDKLESGSWVQLVKLICDEDLEEEFTTFKELLKEKNRKQLKDQQKKEHHRKSQDQENRKEEENQQDGNDSDDRVSTNDDNLSLIHI